MKEENKLQECGTAIVDSDRIRLLAEQGNARAQVRLGECYLEGRGVGRSESEAAAWFARADRQNNSDGAFRLAYCYLCGKGVGQDLVRAAKLYQRTEALVRTVSLDDEQLISLRRRAELGHPDSQKLLGEYCLKRRDCGRDKAEGVRWLRRAAEQNDAEACLYLGDCCRKGLGVERSETEAIRWYRIAAKRGLSRANHALANCYYTGCGVEKDLKEAIRWFRRAADQGLAASQYALGELYFHGIGVRRDPQTAVGYYRRAARRRWRQSEITSKARYKLGLCYMNGTGVMQSDFEAAKWLVKAVEEGSEEAARRFPELRLTPEQKDWLFCRRSAQTGTQN